MASNPFAPPEIDVSGFAALPAQFEAGRKAAMEQGLRSAYTDLAAQIQSGQPVDYNAFAARILPYSPESGLALLKQGQEQAAGNAFSSGLRQQYGGAASPAASAPAGGGAMPSGGSPAMPSGGAQNVEQGFLAGFRQGSGLTNPIGLAAVAAHGLHESGYDPANVNRRWSDPSESGQPGTSGGIMSWRNERLAKLYAFAQQRGEQPSNISPETQGLFLAQENPDLVQGLQNAKTPEEAHQAISATQAYAGYNRPGGENAARLATTGQYLARFTAPTEFANNEADVQRLEAGMGGGAAPARPPGTQVAGPGVPTVGGPAVPPQVRPGTTTPQPASGIPPMPDPMGQLSPRAAWLLDQSTKPGLSQQSKDIAKTLLSHELEASKFTSEQKDYILYRQQGGQMPFFDYQRELKRAGATTIDQRGEGAFATTSNTAIAKRFEKLSEEGDVGRADLALIGQLRQLGGVANTGGRAAVQGWLAERGIKLGDNVGAVEAYGALIDKLTPQQRVPGSGSSSDLDVRMFKAALPRLINTPEGNALISDTLEMMAQDKVNRAIIAEKALTGEIKPGEAVQQLRALPSPNSMFKDRLQSVLQGKGQPAPQGQPGPPAGQPKPSAPAASPVLDEARAAIAAGAKKDAVIQRLRQNGIDPSGL